MTWSVKPSGCSISYEDIGTLHEKRQAPPAARGAPTYPVASRTRPHAREPVLIEHYGARGRRFADEDSDHYLDRALTAGDPVIFEKYARWLRTVLVSRGMCSEHLAENFRLPGQELVRRGLDRRYLVSYLIDAIATGDRTIFDQFARRFDPSVTAALLESAAPHGRT